MIAINQISLSMPDPTVNDIKKIVETRLGFENFSLARFTTGLAHHVYLAREVEGPERAIVVRATTPERKFLFDGALHWYDRLKAVGVPLPNCCGSGEVNGVHFMLLEHLPGKDLGEVYPLLSAELKKRIAEQVTEVEEKVSQLPMASGYGCAMSYEDPALKRSWNEVVKATLTSARDLIRAVGKADERFVDSVEEVLPKWSDYFRSVPAVAGLDDLTTKNVLVDEKGLVGIVDCDQVHFGDILVTLAVTKMSLLGSGYNTDYVEDWAEAMRLSETRRRALDLYTACSCVHFMGELGQRFNGLAEPFNDVRYRRYIEVLEPLLREARRGP